MCQVRHELFDSFTAPIEQALKKMGLKYEIRERIKTPYSIWSKMQNKHVAFDEIYDILAVRIIFTPTSRENEIKECFNIYVELSKIYKSHPDRLRDWVNHPKANGYQSLHVTLMSEQGHWIEVQIRTERMDEIAEQGFAAHWKYKEQAQAGDETQEKDENQEKEGTQETGEGTQVTDDIPEIAEEENELNEWLHTIKEILDDPQPDAMDFLDTIKLNLFAQEIFVFTPKGEIKTMPVGCTVLDFAFSIHTFLGSHCIGAKVNHKLVPVSHKLQSGDQIEILTSKTKHVEPSWSSFVYTAKAKAKIQAILRRDMREMQKRGEEQLTEWLHKNGFEPTQSVIDKLVDFHDAGQREKLFQQVAEKTILLGEKDIDELNGKNKKKGETSSGWRKYVPFVKAKKADEETGQEQELFIVPEKFNRKKPIFITDDNLGQYIFPDCCHPIPGDDVLGYINNKNQIEIHKRACPVANRLKASYGNRILDAKWDTHKRHFFNATLRMNGIDRRGLVNEVTRVLSNQLNIDIRRIMFTTEDGIFEGNIDLCIHDCEDLGHVMDSLKEVDGIKELSRII